MAVDAGRLLGFGPGRRDEVGVVDVDEQGSDRGGVAAGGAEQDTAAGADLALGS
ncbi:hypothetical protein [Streptosporangium sandarakinum]